MNLVGLVHHLSVVFLVQGLDSKPVGVSKKLFCPARGELCVCGEVISLHITEVRVGHVPCELGSLTLVHNRVGCAVVVFRGESATCHTCAVQMAGSLWAHFAAKKRHFLLVFNSCFHRSLRHCFYL